MDLAARYPREGLRDICEIKSASSVQKEHIYDIAFQRLICEATEKIRDVFLVWCDLSRNNQEEYSNLLSRVPVS